ncbi:aldo/keto reductase [Sediminibacillus albus]|uniref:Predicted oxidoreductase n=1 Tax=Sediminibacillus albus TaxID=407036 RepID=A0A1G8YJF0_9BACI|nr:aldo/keto reductase [Sediminibacillus albus]SDK02866.1 Predicted oxidoreductase [Sediminibacillus albus]
MEKALHKRFITKMDASPTFFGLGASPIAMDGSFLHEVLDNGINLIDIASAFSDANEWIGRTIADRRDEYMISCRYGKRYTYKEYSYQAIKQSIDKSLLQLKTDTIDIMHIHFGAETEKILSEGEALQAIKEAQNEGKIQFLGASIDGDDAEKLILSNDFDVVQMEYNLLNQQNESNITLANEKGIGVLIRGGLAGTLLTEQSAELHGEHTPYKPKLEQLLSLANHDREQLHSLALQFLYSNKAINSVLIGAKNAAKLQRQIELLDKEVDEQLLLQAAEIGK